MTLRVITFKVEEELLVKLDLYCINNRKIRSEVIREAIKFYLLCNTKRGKAYKLNSIEENYKNSITRVQEL
ncbi:Transcriptional regulator, RHH [Saccharolobus shibatae B12]|uniref:Transcriptional regulator, RHH n=1 Tax=Saccharolobus shibatae (strain ATCC 51178 / DSM 5389 / JCM 8931 / NBRC 15437 / B12) TaxID=523848 RepID=A0A8F5BL04_SACSH|nr:ribbon-helix-helix protein, CopG family [Saccharolobus shibatae]QXJ27098.1 Transcriptional regulator, RHH [Saccharolobus shibatae B12]QXJ29991.1 Transcriptional regulator, RHH [Saccharolobus shibatae B12]